MELPEDSRSVENTCDRRSEASLDLVTSPKHIDGSTQSNKDYATDFNHETRTEVGADNDVNERVDGLNGEAALDVFDNADSSGTENRHEENIDDACTPGQNSEHICDSYGISFAHRAGKLPSLEADASTALFWIYDPNNDGQWAALHSPEDSDVDEARISKRMVVTIGRWYLMELC